MRTHKLAVGGLALVLLLGGWGCKNENEAQFVIPELGLDLTLPRAVAEDLTYQIREENGDTIAMLNSKKLLAGAPETCNNQLGLGPIGNIDKQIRLDAPTGGERTPTPGLDHKVGDYYLSLTKPITKCAADEGLKKFQDDTVRAFAEAWSKLDTSGLPQKFMP